MFIDTTTYSNHMPRLILFCFGSALPANRHTPQKVRAAEHKEMQLGRQMGNIAEAIAAPFDDTVRLRPVSSQPVSSYTTYAGLYAVQRLQEKNRRTTPNAAAGEKPGTTNCSCDLR